MDRQELEKRWQTIHGVDWQTQLDPTESLRHPAEATLETLVESASMPAAQLPEPGFERLSQLGRGGLGCVYRASQTSLGREVALKVLHPEHARQPARQRDFLSEARLQGRLEHPNIVPVHELGRDPEGRCYLAMKLVRGQSWSAMLRAGQHDLQAHLEILLSVCNAVAFAHTRGIVHLDLKPANVMVGDFGEVLVADWGLAAVMEGFDAGPHMRRVAGLACPCGTPCYMAPELAEGDGARVGTGTDVYLLGGILYRLCTGEPPHGSQSLLQAVLRASQGQFPEQLDQLPAELAALCRRALEPDPSQRLADVGVFARAVRAHLSHRESLRVAQAAREKLRACTRIPVSSLPVSRTDPNQLYAGFAASLAGFEHAQRLWADNPEARAGTLAARLSYAEAALQRGDLGLVETLLEQLSSHGQEREASLRAGLQAARAQQQRERRTRRLLWGGLSAATLMLAAAALLGYWSDAERKAQQSQERQARIDRFSEALDALQAESLLQRAWDHIDVVSVQASNRAAQDLIDSLGIAAVASQRLEQALGEEPDGLPAFDAARSALRERMDVLRSAAVLLACVGGEFGLARSLARPVADPDLLEHLLASISEAASRELNEQLAAVDTAVQRLLMGTSGPARSSWLPDVDEWVVRLSGYRHPEVVAALAAHLQPFIERAAREARRGKPAAWNTAERAAMGLILDVLGYIALPEHTTPVLCAFLSEVWDHRLVVRACSALCRARHSVAFQFMVGSLAPRLGHLSGTWRAVQDLLMEFVPADLDPSDRDPMRWALHGLAAAQQGQPEQALRDFARALELDSLHIMARMHRAHTLQALGRAQEGVADLDELVKQVPDDPDLLCNRGLILLQMKNADGALRDFDAALQIDSLHVPARTNRGLANIELGREEQALLDFTRALTDDPLAGEAWLNRSSLRSRLGDTPGALKDLEWAAQLLPLQPRIHVGRAHILLGLGRTLEAVAAFDQAIATDPYFAVGWMGRGLAQILLGTFNRALEDFDRALELDPHLYDALHGRIRALEGLGRSREAHADLDALLAVEPEHLGARLLRSQLLRQAGAFDAALEDAQEALRFHPQSVLALAERAACFAAMGDLGRAMDDCNNGLALDPQHPLMYMRRGVLHKLLGQRDAALADFDAAVKHGPLLPDGFRERGLFWLDLQQTDKAVADLSQAVELDPADGRILGMLAVALREAGDPERGLRQIEKALFLLPQQPQLVYVQAWLFVVLGRHEEAAESYALLTRLRPNDAEIWRDYGMLLHQVGQQEAAHEAFLAALERSPEDLDLMLTVAASQRGLGNWEAARALLDTVLQRRPDSPVAYLQRAMVCAASGDAGGASDLARSVELWAETPEMAFEAAAALCSQLEVVESMRNVQLEAAARLLRSALAGGIPAEQLQDPRLDSLRGHSGWPEVPGE